MRPQMSFKQNRNEVSSSPTKLVPTDYNQVWWRKNHVEIMRIGHESRHGNEAMMGGHGNEAMRVDMGMSP